MKINDLDDVKMWIARHAGRSDAYWKEQHRWNDRQEQDIAHLEKRLSTLERKIMWLSGLAAAGGSSLGTMLFHILT